MVWCGEAENIAATAGAKHGHDRQAHHDHAIEWQLDRVGGAEDTPKEDWL